MIIGASTLHTNENRFGDMEAILLGYGLCSNADYFEKVKGTFFYNQSWLDLGLELGESDLERKRSEYMEKFDGDEDTVEYLLEMDAEMLKNYHYITYITWPGMGNASGLDKAHTMAAKAGIELLEYECTNKLMADFVNGNWSEKDFLILQPGQTLQPSYDSMIIKGV